MTSVLKLNSSNLFLLSLGLMTMKYASVVPKEVVSLLVIFVRTQ
jgi:hypothetical protein